MGKRRNVHTISVAKPEGNRPLGRHRGKWEDNIKIDLTKLDGMIWAGFVWLRIGTSVGLF
jgi:hypothetical protein